MTRPSLPPGVRWNGSQFDKRAYVFHGTVTVSAIRRWLRARSSPDNVNSAFGRAIRAIRAMEQAYTYSWNSRLGRLGPVVKFRLPHWAAYGPSPAARPGEATTPKTFSPSHFTRYGLDHLPATGSPRVPRALAPAVPTLRVGFVNGMSYQ